MKGKCPASRRPEDTNTILKQGGRRERGPLLSPAIPPGAGAGQILPAAQGPACWCPGSFRLCPFHPPNPEKMPQLGALPQSTADGWPSRIFKPQGRNVLRIWMEVGERLAPAQMHARCCCQPRAGQWPPFTTLHTAPSGCGQGPASSGGWQPSWDRR